MDVLRVMISIRQTKELSYVKRFQPVGGVFVSNLRNYLAGFVPACTCT